MKLHQLECTPWEFIGRHASAREKRARAELWLETSMLRIRTFIADSETHLHTMKVRREQVRRVVTTFKNNTSVEAVRRFRMETEREVRALDKTIQFAEGIVTVGNEAILACGNGAQFISVIEGLTIDVRGEAFSWKLMKRWFKLLLGMLGHLAKETWTWLTELRERLLAFLHSFLKAGQEPIDARELSKRFQLWIEHSLPLVDDFLTQKETQLESLRLLLVKIRKHTPQYEQIVEVIHVAECIVVLGKDVVKACRRATKYIEGHSKQLGDAAYIILRAWVSIQRWLKEVNEGDHEWALTLWQNLQRAYGAARREIKALWAGLLASYVSYWGPSLAGSKRDYNCMPPITIMLTHHNNMRSGYLVKHEFELSKWMQNRLGLELYPS